MITLNIKCQLVQVQAIYGLYIEAHMAIVLICPMLNRQSAVVAAIRAAKERKSIIFGTNVNYHGFDMVKITRGQMW